MKVADYILHYLETLEVQTLFGMSGASIESMFFALKRHPRMKMVVAKHEYSAVTMAYGYHQQTGRPGVVMVTSGGGAYNIIPPLTEATASGVPILAIVGQIATTLEGKGGFQDSSGKTDSINAEKIFAPVAHYCRKVVDPRQLPEILFQAMTAAIDRMGPAILLIPKDVQEMEVHEADPYFMRMPEPKRSSVDEVDLRLRWQEIIKDCAVPPLVIAGPAMALGESRVRFQQWVQLLGAKVAVTPDGKGAFDHLSPQFIGVAGVMGNPNVRRYLEETTLCILVGTTFPLMSHGGLADLLGPASGRRVLNINTCSSFLSRMHPTANHIQDFIGNPAEILSALDTKELPWKGWVPSGSDHEKFKLEYLPTLHEGPQLSYRRSFEIISPFLNQQRDIFVDAGNCGASAIHYLQTRGEGIFSVALGMGGMGHSFGAAIGSTCHSRSRTFVLAGDGSFFMHGLEIHTAIEHELPLTVIIFNNNAHAMCKTRELVFDGQATAENVFKKCHIGKGMAAMFPSLLSLEVETEEELSQALMEMQERLEGVLLLSVLVSSDEFPPFAPFLKK